MSAELKAGLFVMAAVASLVYMTTRLTQNRYTVSGTKTYYALISDATGLLSKSKVKMSGLDVGQLAGMELAGNKKVRISVEIAADMTLYRDASIAVKSIGFLGDKYLELFPGSPSAGVLNEGATIAEGEAGGSLDQLTKKTAELVDNLKDIAQVLRDALKGSGTGDGTRLDRILDNMEQFSEGLAELDKLGDLADRVNEVALNARDITDKVKRGEGTIGKLLTDSETVDKLNETLSGVNKIVSKADRLAIVVDARSSALLGQGGSLSAFSIAIQPTFDKYYLLGLTARPQGVTTTTQTSTTTSPGTSSATTTTTQSQVTNTNSVGIDAQFAKRFGDLFVRFGLFETTGGLAADYMLWEDRAKLTAEVYRFTSGAAPQVNVSGQVQVYRPFYFWTGVDYAATSAYRSFVVGGGIHFNDQDIKSLVTAAVAGGSLK